MDWQTFSGSVAVAVLSSAAVTATFLHFVKKAFDRALDLRVEKALQEHNSAVQETARRLASLYDLQAQAFRRTLTQVYRIRNGVRRYHEYMFVQGADEEAVELLKDDIRKQDEVLRETLYVERAVLPEGFFRMAHEVNRLVNQLGLVDPRFGEVKTDSLEDSLEEIEGCYRELVGRVRDHLGVQEPAEALGA